MLFVAPNPLYHMGDYDACEMDCVSSRISIA